MSKFLYRLGYFAARKAWTIVALWAVIIALLAGSFSAFRGEMTNQITIPGTEAQQVQETLSEKFDTNTTAGFGQAILETENGSAFTEDQKKAVADAVSRAEGVDQVDSVTDPFATATKIADGKKQLEDGKTKVADGEKQMADAKKQLDDTQKKIDDGSLESEARAKIKAGQADIDSNRQKLEGGQQQLQMAETLHLPLTPDMQEQKKQLEEGQKKLEEGQKELDAQKAKLEDGSLIKDAQKQVDDGRTELEKKRPELDAAKKELDRNQALLDMTSDAASISENGSAAIATVSFTDDIMAVSPEHLANTRDAFSSLEDHGVKVLYDTNLSGQRPEMGMTGEMIGIALALIILFVMLGTLIAAGLPILMAVIGVAGAMMGTLALSGVVDMTSTTPALGSMLGLAVGIDYTLFILNRHRNNLAQGMDMKKSIALATGTSGGAVLFAGTTVIIALLALNVVGIPFLSVMGNAAAFAVFMAVAVAVTLSPAILSLVGRRIISKKRWVDIDRRSALHTDDAETAEAAHVAATEKEERPTGWLKAILAKPVVTIIAVVLALGAVALPVSDMRLGLPTGASQKEDTPAHQTYEAISENFGEGQNGTIIAAANLPDGTTEDQAKDLQVEVGQKLLEQNDVKAVIPALISKDNSTLLYQITPDAGPSEVSTENLVSNIRDLKLDTDDGEVSFGVTGQTAMNIDISENLAKVLPIYIAIVIGLSLLVLILVFRSIWVPLTATLGFLFSLAAAFGATTAVFQWGWAASLFGVTTPGPILSFLPIIAVGVLFGLAMDYQLFLVSSMREAYSHGRNGKKSVVVGYNHSARVVVAAALIMAGVFIGFVFAGDPMMASIGFALSAGVLFDAFVIRMTLIPALMYLLGDRAWWLPKWLDKILPDLDVEGTQLEREKH